MKQQPGFLIDWADNMTLRRMRTLGVFPASERQFMDAAKAQATSGLSRSDIVLLAHS